MTRLTLSLSSAILLLLATVATAAPVRLARTPDDFLKGRDAQVEKAVEVLKADLAAGKKKGN